jgi:hypothetical protein
MSRYYDRTMSQLRCPGCFAVKLMSTVAIYNPEQYCMQVERFAAEHRLCSKFKNPAQARAVVRWAKEMKKLDAPPRFVRHSILDEILRQRRPGSWVRG